MNSKMIMSGVILVIVGLILGIAVMFAVMKAYDPVRDPVAEINGTVSVDLKKGDYEIWVDESKSTGRLRITDTHGNEVEVENMKISPSQKGYMADLKFTADETGTYEFERNTNTTLYVMEHQSNSIFLIQFGPCCGGIFLALIGVIVVVLGIIKKKTK
jgi:hypothetical protein